MQSNTLIEIEEQDSDKSSLIEHDDSNDDSNEVSDHYYDSDWSQAG